MIGTDSTKEKQHWEMGERGRGRGRMCGPRMDRGPHSPSYFPITLK